MKKILLSLCAVATLLVSCAQTKEFTQYSVPVTQDKSGVLVTETPVRPANQQDMIAFAAEPIKNVRVGFIGLGMRGPGAVNRMTHIDGVEVVALCDIEADRVERAAQIVTKAGDKEPLKFSGSEDAWKELVALENLDLVYIATGWATHAMMGVEAMKQGKHVAIEVPAAMNMQQIWDLINTSEATRKHCMMLENCVYDFFELTALNMAQKGLFGEVLYGEGAYIHNLEPFWASYYEDWRLQYNINNYGDLYPTHGLGPVCQAMDMHRGDRMSYLTAFQTKTVCIPEFIERTQGRDVSAEYRNGDHTITLIKTEMGKAINIQHNVATPRPYDRMYQLTGTKGFANKYPVEGLALTKASFGQTEDAVESMGHEDLSGHGFVSKATFDSLMVAYQNPIVNDELLETAKKVGGHGGMDFVMDYRLIYCLQNGLPLDMDVYDLAEWCCPTELTAISLENKSLPVEVPDFTRGGWQKLDGLNFAIAK